MMEVVSRTRFLLLGLLAAVSLSACGGKSAEPVAEAEAKTEAETGEETLQEAVEIKTPAEVPEIGKVQRICELASLECYYHNVAKSKKDPGIGLEHLGEKERIFWIEYTGIARFGFKTDQIQMEQDGTDITITLPRPQVTCTIIADSWNEDSYVISEDQRIQKNPITAEDQTKAIRLAEAETINKMRGNKALNDAARQQAQELIKNYIDQIGEMTGVKYNIIWQDATRTATQTTTQTATQ